MSKNFIDIVDNDDDYDDFVDMLINKEYSSENEQCDEFNEYTSDEFGEYTSDEFGEYTSDEFDSDDFCEKENVEEPKTFLDLALIALSTGKRLTVREIWERCGKDFKTSGKTPINTLSCVLHRNMRSKKSNVVAKQNKKFYLLL